MRLFLDAHVSGKRIGAALRKNGHDVRDADDPALEGLSDADLLALATREQRIVVTSNVKDFWPLAQEWADVGHSHAGLIFLSKSIRHEHFGRIIRGVEALLDGTTQEGWIDVPRFVE